MFRYFKCHILWYFMVVKYDGSTDRCGSIECCECFFFFSMIKMEKKKFPFLISRSGILLLLIL